ncbi:hypothetical protein ACQ86N_33925 [Puia sp. P3]|uniref:hypothetical protein n=1 Tax=Puia sp. P3 TaxID=3423952 RepID=UPI003D677E32
MPKEFYSVSYKTYNNARLKKVMFRGSATYPLYLQVTYDRRTVFFKSYYFELLARPRYGLLPGNILQVIDLESRLLDALIDEDAERFTLDGMLRKYRLWSVDVLDRYEESFKDLLVRVLMGEGLVGLAGMVKGAGEDVAGIVVWRDLRRSLDKGLFERMENLVVQEGDPYLPLASYVWETRPDGPICLPLREYRDKEKEIRRFLGGVRGLDVQKVLVGVRGLVRGWRGSWGVGGEPRGRGTWRPGGVAGGKEDRREPGENGRGCFGAAPDTEAGAGGGGVILGLRVRPW